MNEKLHFTSYKGEKPCLKTFWPLKLTTCRGGGGAGWHDSPDWAWDGETQDPGSRVLGGQHRLVFPPPHTYLVSGTLLKTLPEQQSQGATPTVDFHFVSVLGGA